MSKYSHHLGTSERKGLFVSQLTSEQQAELDGFIEWLKTYKTTRGTIMSDGSRGSYRTYMAEVMVLTNQDKSLDEAKYPSSLMSALRLFEVYSGELSEDDDEILEDEDLD